MYIETTKSITCIQDQQTHFNATDIILRYYGHQYVSAIQVAIFGVISLRKRIQL